MAEPTQPKKRPNRSSEYRREQNRLAQKRYRAKKKETWAELNASVAQSRAESSALRARAQEHLLAPRPSPPLPTPLTPLAPLASSSSGEVPAAVANASRLRPLFATMQRAMASSATSQSGTLGLLSPEQTPRSIDQTPESFSNQDEQSQIQALARSILDVTTEFAASVVRDYQASPQDTSNASLADPTFAEISLPGPSNSLTRIPVSAGTLSSYANQAGNTTAMSQTIDPRFLAQHYPYYSSPRSNHLRIEGLNVHIAAMRNASYLGISEADMKEELASPFFTEADALAMPGAARAKQHLYDFLTPDLRPVETQLTVRHPAWIDTIPLPAFRDGMLLHWPVLQMEMHGHAHALLDQLGEDLREGGLVCWEGISSQGRSGIPWDGRSWQLKGWFVRKWKWMFGRGSEDIIRSMQWWATMQGEEF